MAKGYDIYTGLYTSRYYASKNTASDDVIVKVYGGYTVMTASQYGTWRKQR